MKKLTLAGIIFLMAQFVYGQSNPDFTINNRTAIVITDPQNDFMSEQGKGWGIFGESVVKNKTREHIDQILRMAKEKNMLVFVSPHYYFKHDHQWHFEGPTEKMMHANGLFERIGETSGEGFENSGADWYQPFKKYISSDNVIVSSPHKVFGPQTNDLVLQLRKRSIDKVIIIGMAGNMCSESHLRDLQEEGFEAAVIYDATASAIIKSAGIDGPAASLVNFKMLASKVYYTDDFLKEFSKIPVNKAN